MRPPSIPATVMHACSLETVQDHAIVSMILMELGNWLESPAQASSLGISSSSISYLLEIRCTLCILE